MRYDWTKYGPTIQTSELEKIVNKIWTDTYEKENRYVTAAMIGGFAVGTVVGFCVGFIACLLSI